MKLNIIFNHEPLTFDLHEGTFNEGIFSGRTGNYNLIFDARNGYCFLYNNAENESYDNLHDADKLTVISTED